MEEVRSNGVEANEIRVSGIHMEWNPKKGTCTFEKMPVAMMWVDTTLAGLMSGVQAMVGTERFLLALQSEGRKSVEADWGVIAQFPDFREGFKAIANIAAVAGWGEWLLASFDEEKKECRFRVTDSWEGRYQRSLGVCWGSGMLAGKMAGYCSKFLGTNCWADQTAFIARGDAFDEFVVRPSSRSLETEIENLLASDEATRADMAVALQIIEKEIIERTRVEESWRESHQKLQAIIQASPLSIFVLDPEGKVLLWNSASEETFGWTEAEAVGCVLPIVPEDKMVEFRDNLQRALFGEPLRDMELRRRRKDGTPIDIRIFTSTLYDSQGRAIGVMAVNADITERKQAQEKLNQNLREMTLLNKISHLVSSSISLEQMAHATVNGIAEYLDTDLVLFFLKEDASLPLLIVGQQDARYKFDSVPVHRVGECLCGLAARDGQPIYAQDISNDPRCTMVECKEAGLQSFAALPLKSGNTVIGILGLASGTPRDFEKQSTLLETLAAEISLGLRNSLLLEETTKRAEELSQEITERKRAEEALKLNEQRLEALLRLNQMANAPLNEITHFAMEEATLLTKSKIGYVAFMNEDETVLTMYAWSTTAMAECRINEKPLLYPVETTGLWGEAVRQRQPIITNDYAAANPWKKGYPDGHVKIVRHMNVPVFDGDKIVIVAGVGNKSSDYDESDVRQLILLMEGMWRIVQRKRAEQKAVELAAIVQSSEDAIIGKNLDGIITSWNKGAEKIYGYNESEVIGKPISILVPPGLEDEFLRIIEKIKSGKHIEHYETLRCRKDGNSIYMSLTISPIRDAEGNIVAASTIGRDISERKRAEKALRKSQENYRLLVNQIPAVVYKGHKDWSLDCFDRKIEEITGYAKEEFDSRRITWLDLIFPEDVDQAKELFKEAREGDGSYVTEHRIRKKTGEIRWIQARNRIIYDSAGRFDYISGVFFDITERRELEDQLIKAQKMEAVGILAGGVAHDFNNLLTAIMGYSEIMMMGLRQEDPFYPYIEEITKAANRGASLTHQLLAFSRKQILQPRVINLNEVVIDMDNMLRRLIGEDIDLITFIDQELGFVQADPGQIEQIIMNLAVNARDAMPTGGNLTIETANVSLDQSYAQTHMDVSPGPYVMLAMSDNGLGIDAETMSHIFEPFFTTKEEGKGTGLGLATVYGIVKQSGGHIWGYSEPGKGTTFKIYLPRVKRDSDGVRLKAAAPASLEGDDTILVVEDDAALRGFISKALGRYGYKILEAAHGGEALLICESQKSPIHLMLTDVVMPQMSGSVLAERLNLLHPEMKVLYMSGYTENAIVHHGVLNSDVNFIAKPFRVVTLVQKVREVLDTTSPS